MNTAALSLPPKILGFWTKCIRTTMHWSQEALAVNANLTTRTIQRIEAGEPSSVTTRRSLARGLGYENQDIFEDPEFVSTVLKLLEGAQGQNAEEVQKQFPDHVPVSTKPVTNGEALAALAESSNASLFHCDEEVSLEAKQQAACLFDYLRDMVDLWSEISFSDRVSYTLEMGNMVRDLEAVGARVYEASRSAKMVGDHWENKTPIPLTIGYLIVVPREKDISQLMVPKKLS
jgi:DNA-binding XRE family transcriptional regulator